MSFEHVLIYSATFFGLFTSLFFLLTLFENKKAIKRVNKLSEYPLVSILLPSWNAERTIENSINTLLALEWPRDKLEIIVIDDGSTDSTYNIAKGYESRNVRVLQKENGGKGSAMNYGIRHARGRFIGALDPDSYVDRGALKKIMRYFEASEETTAVTAALKVHSPANWLQRIQHIEYLIGVYLRKIFSMLGSINVTPGPFTIFRKSFFSKYGMFDEHNITEDQEIALRMQRNNLVIENCIDAAVYTVTPPSLWSLYKQRLRWYRGFLDNVPRYTDLFGVRHGNLGMLVLPSALISVMFAIMLAGYTAYKFLDYQINNAINLYNVGFDLRHMLSFKFDTFFLNINPMAVLGLVSIVLAITTIMLAKILSNEKSHIKWSYVLFMFFYLPLYASWWLGAIFCKAFNVKLKWGPRYL